MFAGSILHVIRTIVHWDRLVRSMRPLADKIIIIFIFRAKQLRHFSNHLESNHSGNKYICSFCGKVAVTEKKLQRHISLNHEVDKSKKDFICDICGYATHVSTIVEIAVLSELKISSDTATNYFFK